MGRLTTALVTTHHRDLFHATCFYYGPPDDVILYERIKNKSGNVTQQSFFRKGCDEFIDLSLTIGDISSFSAVRFIRSFNLDIIVDLTAHTTGGRIDISAARPSTIMINYLGYPGTTGCSGFQYNMVDSITAPPDILAKSFSEKMIYLPGTYQSNDMPDDVVPCACGVVDVGVLNCCKTEVFKTAMHLDLYGNHSISLLDKTRSLWFCAFNSNKKFEPISFSGIVSKIYIYFY